MRDFSDGFVTTFASQENYNRRLSICHSCEHFNSETNRCGQCNCFVPNMAGVSHAVCPLEKWVDDGDNEEAMPLGMVPLDEVPNP